MSWKVEWSIYKAHGVASRNYCPTDCGRQSGNPCTCLHSSSSCTALSAGMVAKTVSISFPAVGFLAPILDICFPLRHNTTIVHYTQQCLANGQISLLCGAIMSSTHHTRSCPFTNDKPQNTESEYNAVPHREDIAHIISGRFGSSKQRQYMRFKPALQPKMMKKRRR